MKKSVYLVLLLAVIGCRKSKDSSNNVLLREISTDSGPSQVFEYSNGMLAKESNYFPAFCATPIDERTYVYQNGRLDHTETTMRSLYSSISALCNPAGGIRSEEAFEYDAQGRIVKVIRDQAYTEFVYNAAGFVAKQVIYSSNGTPHYSTVFTYDSRGNIIREDDSHSGIRQYEYDNKKNPLYLIKSRPDFISPFTSSPNNVIRGTGNFLNFERRIVLYQHDMPFRVEENGEYYTYTYQ